MKANNRIDKARFLADNGFVKVQDRDSVGRIKSVLVPGSDAKTYEVIVRRLNKITTECILDTGSGGLPCKGNRSKPCYHSIAALIINANEADKDVSFCNDWSVANKTKNFGGNIYTVYSRKGSVPMYMVVNDRNKANKAIEELGY